MEESGRTRAESVVARFEIEWQSELYPSGLYDHFEPVRAQLEESGRREPVLVKDRGTVHSTIEDELGKYALCERFVWELVHVLSVWMRALDGGTAEFLEEPGEPQYGKQFTREWLITLDEHFYRREGWRIRPILTMPPLVMPSALPDFCRMTWKQGASMKVQIERVKAYQREHWESYFSKETQIEEADHTLVMELVMGKGGVR